MKHVLLTGGGPRGFVGRNISPYLRERYVLFAPSSRELDLTDYNAVAKYIDDNKIETVIHGAAQSVINTGPEDVLKHDLQMYYHFEKLSYRLEKVIWFSSGAAYDKRLPMNMVNEGDIGRSVPEWYYALEKYIMTLQSRNSRNMYGMCLFGIFGKYEQWQRKFISNLCCKAMYDLPLTIRQNCMFDFMYIDDLPPIVEWFVENTPKYHDYNVCTGTPVDLVTIAETVCKVSGKDLQINVASDGWNLPYTADNSRLSAEMGDKLRFRILEDSIRDLYAYYEQNREQIPFEELVETR